MAWLEGWQYRKEITLSRASGVVSLYQMKLLVGESAGAIGEDVDCEEHVLSNFNDLRFTTADGQTLLDYWIESITGTTPNQLATVWIEFDSIGTEATTFYMYYGKADAEAASNGANTFILFDNFERGNNGDPIGGDWSVLAGSAVISTDHAFGGTRCGKLVGGVTYPSINIDRLHSDNIAVRFRLWKEDAALVSFSHGDGVNVCYFEFQADEDIVWHDGTTYQDTGHDITPDQWELIEFRNFIWATPIVDALLNDEVIQSEADISKEGAGASYTDKIRINMDGIAGIDAYIDNLIVRNWRTIEPSWGAWGAEEEESPPPGGVSFVAWIN